MNLFPHQELLFQGSKERLHKTITREGGTILENQQFEIVWKCKQAKPLDRLPFLFRCTYENTGNGYLIGYRVVPALATVICMIVSFLVAFYFTYRAWTGNVVEVIPHAIIFFIVPAVWCITQFRNCSHEFRETFGVITTPGKNHKK